MEWSPRELNHRHEQFILHVHQGFNGRQAYQKAYPKASERTADVQASRLLSSPKVKARLAQLQAEMSAALKIDLPFLTGLLMRSYELGLRTQQASAAAQAAMGMAKLHGFLIEKHQVDAVVRRPSTSPDSPDEMSESKWLQDYGPILDLSPSPEGSSPDQYSELFGEYNPSKPTVVPK